MTTPISSVGATPTATPTPAAAGGGDGGLRKAAEAFEAVILRQLMASMRQAKLADDIFGSSATDNFREMADARTADSLASMRQFGIADMVEQQFRGQLGGLAARAGGGVQ
ncbi:flagellar protein FlgJ [Sphingopyxis italica]|uniref:Flagellar protein FlgJ n=1 Tax=Sphingopyxis italica TaxID=1129133 RepID=A0A7X6B8G0_9SPHN|nr:rod-binding protein [Sphingopyxis italica]NJB89254.1 flagellar protein FlgJ [Sphingopyxis italica]